jgi:hypothetical protein
MREDLAQQPQAAYGFAAAAAGRSGKELEIILTDDHR